jgi:malonate transporter and related proteins
MSLVHIQDSAVGLRLAAHAIRLSPVAFAGSLAQITVLAAVLSPLLHLSHPVSPFTRESLFCCIFPLATVVVLLASRYKAAWSVTAAKLIPALALAITVPAILSISRCGPKEREPEFGFRVGWSE